jgi:hypothetical protein
MSSSTKKLNLYLSFNILKNEIQKQLAIQKEFINLESHVKKELEELKIKNENQNQLLKKLKSE